MQALSDPRSGFVVKGYVHDQIAALASHRLQVAPLRFGAGVKGKVCDSWSAGTPVVTTSIGAEGMVDSAISPWGGAVHDDVSSFAASTAQLYCDEAAFAQAQVRDQCASVPVPVPTCATVRRE